jgi:hypothetical protein
MTRTSENPAASVQTEQTQSREEVENQAPEGMPLELYHYLEEIEAKIKTLTFLQKIWEWVKYFTPFVTSSLFTRRDELSKQAAAFGQVFCSEEGARPSSAPEGHLPSDMVQIISSDRTPDGLEATALGDSMVIVQAPQHEGEGQVAQSNLALTGTVCAIL